MRNLILLRGAPGCGKSTWIKQMGLEDYVLSADSIRMLHIAPVQQIINESVEFQIDQNCNREVWDMLFKLLEARMQKGCFTVIDACNTKTAEINRYKSLADKYRYRITLVDFTSVPKDQVLAQNATRRPEYKRVPSWVIENAYARFETQKVPSGIAVIDHNIKAEAFFKYLEGFKLDITNMYKKLYVFGDIHGCYTVLNRAINEIGGIKDENLYVFSGDYIDRGLENRETLNYLMELSNKQNCIFLEGNHEIWLWKWANNEVDEIRSGEFLRNTMNQLEGIDKKEVRRFYRRLRQCGVYTFGDKVISVCHGGNFNYSLFTNTVEYIKGVGRYENDMHLVDAWNKSKDANEFMVFGHRNVSASNIVNGRVCLLEGKVEMGGDLRVVEFDKDSNVPVAHYFKNEVFNEMLLPKKFNLAKEEASADKTVEDYVNMFRNDKEMINEKAFGDISSFNFSRQAFSKRNWSNVINKARGLYIDTKNMKVVARGYNKFFNVNELNETSPMVLAKNLKFPVNAYLKENGFLGLVSVVNDEFFITTKSSPVGDMAVNVFKPIFEKFVNGDTAIKLRNLLKESNSTAVFEVIDPVNDPHIVEYFEERLILLDIIKNDMQFSKLDYDKLVSVANDLGIDVKQKVYTIESSDQFLKHLNSLTEDNNDVDYLMKRDYIEGYVFEDSNNYMFKVKLQHYNMWKKLRKISQEVLKKGYSEHTGQLINPVMNSFYGWLKNTAVPNMSASEKEQADIIKLRNAWLDSVVKK